MKIIRRILKFFFPRAGRSGMTTLNTFFRYTIESKNTEINPVINYYKNRFRFKAVAKPHKIIWVRTKDIRLWLRDDKIKRKKYGGGEIRDGDWDLDTNTIEQQRDFLGKWITAHFKDGIPWEETGLFQSYYVKKMKREGVVHGCKDIQELINKYNDEIDDLYYSMKKNGVLLRSKDRWEIDFMYVHIGREGELIYTSGGNHRLFIAKLLNIDYLPVRVWWRHKRWQEIREKLSTLSEQQYEDWVIAYLNHPDLADIFQPQNEIA